MVANKCINEWFFELSDLGKYADANDVKKKIRDKIEEKIIWNIKRGDENESKFKTFILKWKQIWDDKDRFLI